MTHEEFSKRYVYNTTTDHLGEGGFGKVFKAYDTYLDKWVAIKIAPVLPNFETIRLKKEVDLISKLPVHPNIARYEGCYTFSSFDGEYDFGILQYYEEGNLLQLINKNILTREQKYSILTQILHGLSFLHEKGIIHRDLKPQNILMVKRANEYIPKITDFGISKKLDINNSSVFSNSLMGAGTLAYSSPEQLGDKAIRKNTDLWSFGVIACQLLTGELPFNTGHHASTSEAGRQELFSQINSGQLPAKIGAIDEPWQTLIRRCLIKDSNNRIHNTEELLAILNGDDELEEDIDKTIIYPQPIELEIQTRPETASQSVRTTARTIESTPASKPKSKLALLIGIAAAVVVVIAGIFLFRPDSTMVNEISESLVTDSIPDRVEINGVIWATRNVGEPGKFVKSPTDYGGYYTWDEACTVCPPGWRLPTKAEFESLVAAGSVWTDEGRSFANNKLFLPAAGYRQNNSSGNIGTYGHYWSNMPNSSTADNAYGLTFNSETSYPSYNGNRYYGRNVRCVKTDTTDPDNKRDAETDNSWLASYQNILDKADRLFAGKNYTSARDEYNKALRLIPSNNTDNKATIVRRKITDCNSKIAEVEEAARVTKEQNIEKKSENPYLSVEQMPQFPGGDAELLRYVSSNLSYPTIAAQNGIEGLVVIRFVINKNGVVSDAEILRRLDPSCDKEAKRIVLSMPKWVPGKKDGRNVAVYYTLPIRFQLTE